MNEQNGVRAIQRLREMLLEERLRLVPIDMVSVSYNGIDWKVIKLGFENEHKEVLDKILEKDMNVYELCLTYRRRSNK